MKYVQGPVTTEIIAPAQTVDSLSTLSSTALHPGLEWLMSRTDGKLRPLYLMTVQGVGQSLMGEIGMNKIPHPTSLKAVFSHEESLIKCGDKRTYSVLLIFMCIISQFVYLLQLCVYMHKCIKVFISLLSTKAQRCASAHSMEFLFYL